MSMTTSEIMELALKLAGQSEVPKDSAIYVDGEGIRKVLLGIDIDTAEVLLAKQLGADCVISHHPTDAMMGWYNADAWQVYLDHIPMMVEFGIPEERARAAVIERAITFREDYCNRNFDRVVSTCKLLGMPLMNIHKPLDHIGLMVMRQAVDSVLGNNASATAQDLIDALDGIPEIKKGNSMRLAYGSPSQKVRKAVVSHACLGAPDHLVIKEYLSHGADAVICIKLDRQDAVSLGDIPGCVIVTGHIASDSIGINPLVSELEKSGVEVLTVNGIIR